GGLHHLNADRLGRAQVGGVVFAHAHLEGVGARRQVDTRRPGEGAGRRVDARPLRGIDQAEGQGGEGIRVRGGGRERQGQATDDGGAARHVRQRRWGPVRQDGGRAGGAAVAGRVRCGVGGDAGGDRAVGGRCHLERVRRAAHHREGARRAARDRDGV